MTTDILDYKYRGISKKYDVNNNDDTIYGAYLNCVEFSTTIDLTNILLNYEELDENHI